MVVHPIPPDTIPVFHKQEFFLSLLIPRIFRLKFLNESYKQFYGSGLFLVNSLSNKYGNFVE